MNFTNISNFSQPLESDEMTSTLAVYITEGETAGLVVFLVFFGLTGFLQNLVLILSISLTDGFADTPANLFILSLAFADLLLCAVSAPLLIYNMYHSIFNIYTTVSIFVVAATTGSIFLLTLNRFVSTVRPLKYQKNHDIRTKCSYDRSCMVCRNPCFCRGIGYLVHRKENFSNYTICRCLLYNIIHCNACVHVQFRQET